MAEVSTVLTRTEGPVRVITINDPKTRNAMGFEFFTAANQAFVDAENDESVSSIVLVGAGGFFSSGGNLAEISAHVHESAETRRKLIEILNDLVRIMNSSTKPIIIAVEGGAAGAGFSLALAGNILISAKDAFYSAAYVLAGLTPDGGLTKFLAESVPRTLLNSITLTGERVTAERLYNAGAISHLVEPGQAEATAIQLGTTLAAGARNAQARIIKLNAQAYDSTLQEQLSAEADAMVESQSDEGLEGMAAVLERRQPNFS